MKEEQIQLSANLCMYMREYRRSHSLFLIERVTEKHVTLQW